LDRILLADLAVSLPVDMLHKVDLASMACSLEVRVPLLSTDVVDLVTALPIEYRILGTTGKRILRDAFQDILPQSVLGRRKMGFEVPVGEFLRKELRAMYGDVVTPATLRELGIDPAVAGDLYDRHTQRRGEHTEMLSALLVLCWWKRSG
jgi:asparagine synthase (glutamine-hydrolysing)